MMNLPKHMKKGHQLVFSRQDLSAREADLFALMIASMKPSDWGKNTPKYQFTASQLASWLNLATKHIGSSLSPVAERLAVRTIGVKKLSDEGDIEFSYTPLFKFIEYKNRTLTLIPNDTLKSEYIQYNQGFALINTKNYLNLNKEYSKRLYEILSRFKNNEIMNISYKLEELKGMFGLLNERGKLKKDKASFNRSTLFVTRCIKDSIKEIQSFSETKKEIIFLKGDEGSIGFNTLRHGRKIIGIEFLYQWTNRKNIPAEINKKDAIKIIKELELKRLKEKKILDIEELNSLSLSYETIGEYETANEIKLAIDQLNKTEEIIEEEPDVNIFLEKIKQIKQISGNPKYN